MKKRGRPRTGEAKRRQFRVHDEPWAEIQDGAKLSGYNFTQWAVPLLLKEARRLIRKKRKSDG
jgi:hypothetical protein